MLADPIQSRQMYPELNVAGGAHLHLVVQQEPGVVLGPPRRLQGVDVARDTTGRDAGVAALNSLH